jgi:H+-transporting ATPase
MSGAVVERGELEMLVTKTGENSFYGKALALLGQAQPPGHLKTILMKAAKWDICIYLILSIVIAIV